MDIDISTNMEGLNITNTNNNLHFSSLQDPKALVKSSFENFLTTANSTEENKLTREKFLQWNFIKDLEDRMGIQLLDNKDLLKRVPFLTELIDSKTNINGRLVKFNCMIQNVLENQLYLAAGYQKGGDKKIIINKFYEYEENVNSENTEEDLICDSPDKISDSILMERLVLTCVPLPGLNLVTSKALKADLEIMPVLKKKKILVYDYENSSHKVNEEILIVGVAYEAEEEIIIHSWKMQVDFISSLGRVFPELDIPFPKINFSEVRKRILDCFNLIFNGDELISEYMVLLLVSQVFSRVGTMLIGKLSLNIVSKFEEYDFFPNLERFIQLISDFSITYTPTVESLNKDLLYPRFDVNTEELLQGILQTVKHTIFMIDERNMNEGKLNNNGCKNYAALKSLIDFQAINYEYPYSNVEIQHDSPVLIISNKVKSMFSSNSLIELPFTLGNTLFNESYTAKHKQFDIFWNELKEEEVVVLNTWYNLVKFSEDFKKNFKISTEVSENIQKDYIAEDKSKFTADDFDMSIKLARLYAISNGRNELQFDDYLFTKQLETKRKTRINALSGGNKHK